jgi:F-type H+-transporting ATPase subunit epsilon
MNKKIPLTITSPEKIVFQDEVDSISVPTTMGEITVLPQHIPLISLLTAGEIIIRLGHEEISMAISGGFLEVRGEGVTVLADTAERSEEIDEARAEEAKKRAQSLLSEKRIDAVEFATLSAKLEKELARLKVVRKRRKKAL